MLPLPPLWIAAAIGAFKRAKSGATVKDGGSLRLFWLVIPLAIALGFVLAAGFPRLALPFAPALAIAGNLLALAGLALRWYAIVYLGRWFTVNVAIAADQPLIDRGPYRRIRHPSYTGALLSMLGVGLSLGNGLALAAMSLSILPVFLHRIRIEEQALAQAFGTRWQDYCERSWRLLPGVY